MRGGGAPTDRPRAYRGPYPVRGPSLADIGFEGEPRVTLTIDDPDNGGSEAGAWAKAGYAHPDYERTFGATIGCAEVSVFHNGYFWVMRFAERDRCNRLTFGHDLRQMNLMHDAFNRALMDFHSPFPAIMVGGVQFHCDEAREMRDLLWHVCRDAGAK
jgi:hypothetical protein